MKQCEWCLNDFEPNVSYQIYCSAECRELSARNKIAQRYQVMRLKNRGKKPRKCSGGCGTIISMYNENGFCSSCMVNKKKVDKAIKELRGLFEYEQKDK
jgi:hypothetical protein